MFYSFYDASAEQALKKIQSRNGLVNFLNTQISGYARYSLLRKLLGKNKIEAIMNTRHIFNAKGNDPLFEEIANQLQIK